VLDFDRKGKAAYLGALSYCRLRSKAPYERGDGQGP
jgi:hypothetical protein